jgi:hypothetical protein
MTTDRQTARNPAGHVPGRAEPLLLDEAAEILSDETGGLLSAVEIRECLEFEPLAEAREKVAEVLERDPGRPIRPLRAWAEEHRRGHYRPRAKKPSGSEEYRRFLRFHGRRARALEEGRGHAPSQRESDELAGEFYAPHQRAAMNGIPPAAWDALHGGGSGAPGPRAA